MPEGGRIAVANDELVTVRDAMRGLHRMVEQLASREREQFVLMHRGRMVARIVPVPPGGYARKPISAADMAAARRVT